MVSAPPQFVTVHGSAAPVQIPLLDLGQVERSISEESVKKTVSSELPSVSDIGPTSEKDSFYQAAYRRTPESFFNSSNCSKESAQDLPALIMRELAEEELHAFGSAEICKLKQSLNVHEDPLLNDRIDFICGYLITRLEQHPYTCLNAQIQSELAALLQSTHI